MWKKMESCSSQASSQTIIKKQKSQMRGSLNRASINSITIQQNSDRKPIQPIQQVNFEFDPISNRFSKQNSARQIHSKQGTKRIGGKVVMQPKRQKRGGKKENHCQKKSHEQSNKEMLNDSCLSPNDSQIVLLEIKSCLIDKLAEPEQFKSSTQTKKHTRYSSNVDSSTQTQQSLSNPQTANTSTLCKNAQELFEAVNRKMAEESELYKVRRTNKNCFFYKLKLKLQKEINRIQKQGQRNQCKFLIEGCEIEKHRRDPSSKALTERARPKTALSLTKGDLSTTRIENQRTRRPMSCQSRSPIHSRDTKLIKQQSKKLLLSPREQPKRERNTVKEKECENKYIMNSLITFDNSATLKPYKSPIKESTIGSKTSLNRNKDNEKLNQILNECDGLGTRYSSLNSKMKTFQFYCKKMDVGMERAGVKLNDLNEALDED